MASSTLRCLLQALIPYLPPRTWIVFFRTSKEVGELTKQILLQSYPQPNWNNSTLGPVFAILFNRMDWHGNDLYKCFYRHYQIAPLNKPFCYKDSTLTTLIVRNSPTFNIRVNIQDPTLVHIVPWAGSTITTTNLTKLNLAHCQLSKLPSLFKNLVKLQDLNLAYNNFTAFPAVLLQLPALLDLYFDGNDLSSDSPPESLCYVPPQLKYVSEDVHFGMLFRLLSLRKCKLHTLPRILSTRVNDNDELAYHLIDCLILSDNQLTVHRSSYSRYVDLRNNQIRYLTFELGKTSELYAQLSGNPLTRVTMKSMTLTGQLDTIVTHGYLPWVGKYEELLREHERLTLV